MSIRSIAVVLTSAAAFAATPAMATAAHAESDAWRFVAQYRTLTACQNAGAAQIASHRAQAYKCENDYTDGGAPALDLYVR